MTQKPFTTVPIYIYAFVLMGLVVQILVHGKTLPLTVTAKNLPSPPSYELVNHLSFGEPVIVAKWLMLYIQAFDNQPGISIPFRSLDYVALIKWLDLILALDPNGQYPLLAASRLYAEVPNESKQRLMLQFIYQKFLEDPNKRWQWLAHATLIARHRLNDIQLARMYAKTLREKITVDDVPHWVTQMEALLAEDMNELETAKILIGGLLASGKITDPREFHFLQQRLEALEVKTK